MNQVIPTQKTGIRTLFVGPDGIRAGWSTLIFVALFIAVLLATSNLLHLQPPKDEISIKGGYFAELVQIFSVLVAMAVMGKIEGKSMWSYGLSGSRSLTKFAIGWIAGLIMLSTVIAILYCGGYLVIDGLALLPGSIFGYGLIWFVGFALVGIAEELVFRGYLQNTLTRGIGKWPAFVVLALLFAVAHMQNGGENAVGLICVVAAGFLLCILRSQSGSLWLGIGVHAAWDWSQSFLYGTPDSGLMVQGHMLLTHAAGDVKLSGGAVGPEGSLFAQPVLLIGILVLIWVCRRVK
jgi:membrane protease YdiL (CAAX protease family)